MTNKITTFFQNCFQRIPVSLDIRQSVFNGFLEHFTLKGFFYIFKIAKEFYYSASPTHLKNAFNQESMVNEAFVCLKFWRKTEEFPFQQKMRQQQISYWLVLSIASQNANEPLKALSDDIGVQLSFRNFNIQKKFQITKNYKQF